jgi:hypothetical protein
MISIGTAQLSRPTANPVMILVAGPVLQDCAIRVTGLDEV